MKKLLPIWIAFSLALAMSLPAAVAQTVEEDIDSIVRAVLLNYPDVPGMVVGVHHPDHGSHVLAFGVERLGDPAPLQPDALFSIGSINKNFMFVLMHRLHEAGRIDIYDQPYYENPTGDQVYINQLQDTIFKYRGDRFSIADLMKHTTGMVNIPNSSNYPFNITNDLFREFSIEDALKQLFHSEQATRECASVTSGMCNDFIMGVDHSYSSYGPTIAAVIAEIETGESARALEKEYIFDVIDMPSTAILAYDDPPGNLTPGHDCLRDSTGSCSGVFEVLDWYDDHGEFYWDPWTIASMYRYPIYSTVGDILNYTRTQFNNEAFLSSATLDAMTTDYVLQYNVFKVGLGVINYEYLWSGNGEGDDFFGHLGDGTFGYGTCMAHRRKDHLSVVVFSNIRSSTSQYEQFPHLDITKAIGAYFWEP